MVVSYKECLKNHAARLGGHALDGCGEFMPSPTSTPTDPASLKCAACGYHRNFHRCETYYGPPTSSSTQPASRPPVLARVPLRKLLRVASVSCGIQLGWALQLSLLTPYVQELGIPHKWASIIWL
ncbi:hypothetical protein CRYUN_Cryun35bG0044700 [Craigia yunnanensis]